MTLGELIRQLAALRASGEATDNSPVILEGNDEDDNLVQACIDGCHVEIRCDDEPGVFLDLSELSIG